MLEDARELLSLARGKMKTGPGSGRSLGGNAIGLPCWNIAERIDDALLDERSGDVVTVHNTHSCDELDNSRINALHSGCTAQFSEGFFDVATGPVNLCGYLSLTLFSNNVLDNGWTRTLASGDFFFWSLKSGREGDSASAAEALSRCAATVVVWRSLVYRLPSSRLNFEWSDGRMRVKSLFLCGEIFGSLTLTAQPKSYPHAQPLPLSLP